MTTPWKTKESSGGKKLRGVAIVKVLDNGVVRLAFKDDPETLYEFDPVDAPENVRKGTWFVSLSGNGEKFYSFSPISGVEKNRFVKFAAAKDQLPAPKEYSYTGKDKASGKEFTSKYMAFTAIHVVTEGKNAGIQFAIFLRYYFAEVDGEVAIDHLKSPHTATLMRWLDATGAFDKGPMNYSENILPALEKRLLKANHELVAIFVDGNVDSITRAAPTEEPEDEEEGETTSSDEKEEASAQVEAPFDEASVDGSVE